MIRLARVVQHLIPYGSKDRGVVHRLVSFAVNSNCPALLPPPDPTTGTLQPGAITQDAHRTRHSPATASDPHTPTIQTFEQANAPSAAQRVVSARSVALVALCFRGRVGGEAGHRFPLPLAGATMMGQRNAKMTRGEAVVAQNQQAGQVMDELLAVTLDAIKVVRQRVRLEDEQGKALGGGDFAQMSLQTQYDAAKYILDHAAPLIQELKDLTRDRTARGL